MRSLRCVVGRHDWLVDRNPEQGGADALTEVCSRCGRDRPVYEPTDGRWIAPAGLGGPNGIGMG